MILLGVLTLLFTGAALVAGIVWAVRRTSPGSSAAITPEPGVYVPTGTDSSVIRALSERLALVEGRYNSMSPIIEGYGTMSERMMALEAKLPGLIDVLDKLDSTTKNSEKRKDQRVRDQAKRDAKDDGDETITAEQAFAQMNMDPAQLVAADAPAVGAKAPPQARKGLIRPRQNGT